MLKLDWFKSGRRDLETMGLGPISVACRQRGAPESYWTDVLIREFPSWLWSSWRHWLEDPAPGLECQLS